MKAPSGTSIDFEAWKSLADRVGLVDRQNFWRAFCRLRNCGHDIHGFARADRPHRKGRGHMLAMHSEADFGERQENPLHRLGRDIEITEDRIERF